MLWMPLFCDRAFLSVFEAFYMTVFEAFPKAFEEFFFARAGPSGIWWGW